MKNYKSKNGVIIEEINGEMSTLSAPTVEAPIIDKIPSYRRTNLETPVLRVIL